jgi:hypothetical protein
MVFISPILKHTKESNIGFFPRFCDVSKLVINLNKKIEPNLTMDQLLG